MSDRNSKPFTVLIACKRHRIATARSQLRQINAIDLYVEQAATICRLLLPTTSPVSCSPSFVRDLRSLGSKVQVPTSVMLIRSANAGSFGQIKNVTAGSRVEDRGKRRDPRGLLAEQLGAEFGAGHRTTQKPTTTNG